MNRGLKSDPGHDALHASPREATSTAFGDRPRQDSTDAVYVASSDSKWGDVEDGKKHSDDGIQN